VKNQDMKAPTSMHRSPSPTPQSPPTAYSIAYADPWDGPLSASQRSTGFFKLGKGVGFYSHRKDQPGWLSTCTGFVRDVLEQLKSMFRSPEDQFADLRRRGPIEVGVEVKSTITPVRPLSAPNVTVVFV
jgi:hypothetical protein